jgi:hypothetical protein
MYLDDCKLCSIYFPKLQTMIDLWIFGGFDKAIVCALAARLAFASLLAHLKAWRSARIASRYTAFEVMELLNGWGFLKEVDYSLVKILS